ncbi:MAG: 30S ribosomal protein S20 [Pirellulales bacterium]|nr:30S ribosomal protein S20 [Pirellulales bacterium]
MPNIKSTKKRLRQNVVRRTRNLSAKRTMRTRIRKVLEAVRSGDVALAETEFKLTARTLDRAGARNLIHRNAAARLKSRLSAKIKFLKQIAAEV